MTVITVNIDTKNKGKTQAENRSKPKQRTKEW